MISARVKVGGGGATGAGAGTQTLFPASNLVDFFALLRDNTFRNVVLFFSAMRHHESPLFTVYVAGQLAAETSGAAKKRPLAVSTAQARTRLMRLTMAERVGFEPTVRFTRTTP